VRARSTGLRTEITTSVPPGWWSRTASKDRRRPDRRHARCARTRAVPECVGQRCPRPVQRARQVGPFGPVPPGL